MNNISSNISENWKPFSSFHSLHKRADLISNIRIFFKGKNVLEVETPILSISGSSHSEFSLFHTTYEMSNSQKKYLYLQTSPESAMKRLLAAGSGPIYQICKAFRKGDDGSHHNPEFTILEWYQPEFDHHDLMDEMDEFLNFILNLSKAERITYKDLFVNNLGIDPHIATIEQLKTIYYKLYPVKKSFKKVFNRDNLLDYILEFLKNKLTTNKPSFVYDFPESQACLANVRQEHPPVSERFEVYYKGLEIANGYHELTDPEEFKRRFEKDNIMRKKLGLETVSLDEYLLESMSFGLPKCAGVAVGVDRLVMLKLKTDSIKEVLAFPFDRA